MDLSDLIGIGITGLSLSDILSSIGLFIGIALVAWIILLIVKFAIFKYFDKFCGEHNKCFIRDLIYKCDEFADEMSNKEKKESVVNTIATALKGKKLFIPKFLIGWVVDAEVATIRKLQKSCEHDTNLHKDGE